MNNVRCAQCGLLNFAGAGGAAGEMPAGEMSAGGPTCGFCGYETPERWAPFAPDLTQWTRVYRAVAVLERPDGGRWHATEFRKSEDFDEKTELSAF